MTNFERIKAMTVEEMAEHLSKGECYSCKKMDAQSCDIHCKQGIRQWLESEVQEDDR